MDVVCANDIDETEYVSFLDGFASRPGVALAYHYPFYLRFLSDMAYPGGTRRFVTARDAKGALVGVLPAVHVKTAAVSAWLSLAYFGPNGGALVPDAASAAGALTIRELVANARLDAVELGCGSMTIYTPLEAPADDYRAGLGGHAFEIERVSQVLVFPDGAEQSPWPSKVRYDVRRAAALGVTVRAIDNERELDAVWQIYQRNCEDAGIPLKAREHLFALYRSAGSRGVFLLAEHAGAIVAGLVCLMGGGVLSYYLPCTRAAARPMQPGLLLLDHAVARAREAGCGLLNFESSPGADSSVYQFKSRCGGEPVAYRVFVSLLTPGALDGYRRLGAEGLAREASHAFIVPFEALA
jgi:hypothetical protein